jgi:hypothetical protein
MIWIPALAAAVVSLAPGCHHAVLENNSGIGPNWPIVICDSDDRLLIVDGGPIGPGAVILGFGKEHGS